jgi:hypothetical protein
MISRPAGCRRPRGFTTAREERPRNRREYSRDVRSQRRYDRAPLAGWGPEWAAGSPVARPLERSTMSHNAQLGWVIVFVPDVREALAFYEAASARSLRAKRSPTTSRVREGGGSSGSGPRGRPITSPPCASAAMCAPSFRKPASATPSRERTGSARASCPTCRVSQRRRSTQPSRP